MAMALIPVLLPLIPELYRLVKEMIDTFNAPEMSPEERQARLADISRRLDLRIAEVEAYRFRDVPDDPQP